MESAVVGQQGGDVSSGERRGAGGRRIVGGETWRRGEAYRRGRDVAPGGGVSSAGEGPRQGVGRVVVWSLCGASSPVCWQFSARKPRRTIGKNYPVAVPIAHFFSSFLAQHKLSPQSLDDPLIHSELRPHNCREQIVPTVPRTNRSNAQIVSKFLFQQLLPRPRKDATTPPSDHQLLHTQTLLRPRTGDQLPAGDQTPPPSDGRSTPGGAINSRPRTGDQWSDRPPAAGSAAGPGREYGPGACEPPAAPG